MDQKNKIKKIKTIKELKEGDIINGDIFVVKIKIPVKEYSRGFFFSLHLTDNSGGNVEYKYWGGSNEEEVKKIYDMIKCDDVVLINGSVSSYNGRIQISASDQHKIEVLLKDQYNEEDFIKKSDKNIDEMYETLNQKIELIQDEKLKNFVKDILEEKKEFKFHPAAISIHHNCIGGLLQHTLEIIDYCETAKKNNKELNLDLLIAGAIIHDIGKIEELEVTTRIKASQKGLFIGHLSLGFSYISKKIEEFEFDDSTKNKILHLIISHHGKEEYGSPKTPMIPEALVLYFSDELSCKVANMIEYIKDNKDITEDEFGYKYKYNKGDNIFLR